MTASLTPSCKQTAHSVVSASEFKPPSRFLISHASHAPSSQTCSSPGSSSPCDRSLIVLRNVSLAALPHSSRLPLFIFPLSSVIFHSSLPLRAFQCASGFFLLPLKGAECGQGLSLYASLYSHTQLCVRERVLVLDTI